MTSPGEAVFGRELSEFRILGNFLGNYSTFTAWAVAEVVRERTANLIDVLLEQEFDNLVVKPAIDAATFEGYKTEKALEWYDRHTLRGDIIDMIKSLMNYARAKGLSKRATRNLLRDHLLPSSRILEPVPEELMAMSGKGAPTVSRSFPFIERGMSIEDRLAQTARTLATNVEGWAAREQARKTGADLRWITVQDDKVRPAHVHAQGQTVAHDEPFYVGGFPMWYPGDFDAPEELTVNCRCSLAIIEPNPQHHVQRFIPNEWLNAAGQLGAMAPAQARAPKGTRIGGQWIDTPGAILRSLNRLEQGTDLSPRGPLGDIDAAKAERRAAAAKVLAQENRPSLEESADRLTEVYGMIDQADRDKSVGWYGDAQKLRDEMVADPRTDLNEEQAAAIIAHLSTRTRWEANADYARSMAAGLTQAEAIDHLKAEIAAGRIEPARKGGDGIMDRNWQKALDAAASDDPIGRGNRTLGTFSEANKTRTFASNIMGDQDGVTIDSHMEDLLGQKIKSTGKSKVIGPRGKPLNLDERMDMVYESLAEATRVAADRAGLTPAQFQAIVWGWSLAARVDERKGHPARLEDPKTHKVLPITIGGEQALIDAGDLAAALSFEPDPPEFASIADEPMPDYWYAMAALLLGLARQTAPELEPGFGVNDDLTAAAFATVKQARAPKGTMIGGQWIDTPNAILHSLGWTGEGPNEPDRIYVVDPIPPPPAYINQSNLTVLLDEEMPSREEVPPEGVKAVQEYSTTAFAGVNNTLRGTPMTPYERRHVPDPAGITRDMMTASAPLPRHVITYRGLGEGMLGDHPEQFIGQVVRDKAFMSTSLDPSMAKDMFGYRKAAYLKITAPKGTRAIWANPLSVNRGEMELILPPSTALAILGTELDSEGRTVVLAQVVPEADSLTAAAPNQARAPKGVPIGGEWIETPAAMLDMVRSQGGASIDPLTGLQPTDGYQVGVKGYTQIVPEDEFFGPNGADTLVSWIDAHQEQLSQPGGHVGLWHDTETGNVVFDVSLNVKDRDEAIRMGQEGDQVSIWDNVAGDEIQTGGTGEGLRSSADPQADTHRMEDYDRPEHPGPSPARRLAARLGRLGRGAQARVRAGDDRRAPDSGLTFAPNQARAPKGSAIGGQWIDTPSALRDRVERFFEDRHGNVEQIGDAPANQIGGGRRAKYAAPLADNSPASALKGNPNGGDINCQKCTTVYEMRRRGMDVVAGTGMGENTGMKKGLGDYFSTGRPVRLADEVAFTDNATDKLRASAEYLTGTHGPNTRGAIEVAWDSGGAHVFNWEVDADNKVHYMDAQVGKEITGKTLTWEFTHATAYSIRFQRLDNAGIGNPAQDVVDQTKTPLYDEPQQAVTA